MKKPTAAHEALVICAKLYPWRAKVHLGNDSYAYVQYIGRGVIVLNWRPKNATTIPSVRHQ